jgi:hypothetical protein
MPEFIDRVGRSGNDGTIRPRPKNAEAAIDGAARDGLDPEVAGILKGNLDDQVAQGCLGVDPRTAPEDTIVLVSMVVDGSGSMSDVAAQVVRCYDRLMGILGESEFAAQILASTWVFNDTHRLVHGFLPVFRLPSFGCSYLPSGSTALYDTVLAAETGQVAYSQHSWDADKGTKNIVIVMSDGADNVSRKDPSGARVRRVSDSLLEQGDYILAYIGFGAHGPLAANETKGLARTIGFPDVISAGMSANEMDDIFRRLAISIIRACDSTAIIPAGQFFAT